MTQRARISRRPATTTATAVVGLAAQTMLFKRERTESIPRATNPPAVSTKPTMVRRSKDDPVMARGPTGAVGANVGVAEELAVATNGAVAGWAPRGACEAPGGTSPGAKLPGGAVVVVVDPGTVVVVDPGVVVVVVVDPGVVVVVVDPGQVVVVVGGGGDPAHDVCAGFDWPIPLLESHS